MRVETFDGIIVGLGRHRGVWLRRSDYYLLNDDQNRISIKIHIIFFATFPFASTTHMRPAPKQVSLAHRLRVAAQDYILNE